MDKKPEKLVPEVRFKGFTDDWEQRKLKSISNISSGGTPNKNNKEYWNGNIFWITTSEIHYNQITKSKDTITQLGLDNSSAKILHPGTILMAMYGQGKTRGQVGLLKTAAATNQAVAAIVPHQIVKTNFLYSFLEKEYLHIRNYANSGSQSNLSLTIIGSQNIIFSKNIVEQSKIGNILSNISTLITLQQRKLEQLKQLKKALLQQLFVDKNSKLPILRFKNFNGDWKKRKLEEIGKATGGTSIESEFSPYGSYKVINIGSYSEDHSYNDQGIRAINSDKTQKRILNKHDLTMILNDKTSTGKIIGSVLIIPSDNKYVYNQRTERIEPNTNHFSSLFLYHYLNAPIIRKKIISNAQGNTQIYVNWSSISKINYYIPNLSEQNKIGEFLDKVSKTVTLQQNKLAQLTTLKKYLLQKIFI